MANEVATKTANALSTDLVNDWGNVQVSSQDIIIPKILPMQGLSVAVAEGNAQMGEFRDSLTNKLLGDITKPIHCIPFFMQKTWDVLHEQADGAFKYSKSVPVVENPLSADYNDNWKWETTENGIKVKNVRRFNFFVLLPDEVEAGGAVPYMFSFKSTSMKEGKKLFSQMYMRNTRAGVPPAAFTIKIGGSRQKNAKGIFIVPNFVLDRKTTDEELAECLTWIKMIRGGQTKIDVADDITDSGDTSFGAEGTAEF